MAEKTKVRELKILDQSDYNTVLEIAGKNNDEYVVHNIRVLLHFLGLSPKTAPKVPKPDQYMKKVLRARGWLHKKRWTYLDVLGVAIKAINIIPSPPIYFRAK